MWISAHESWKSFLVRHLTEWQGGKHSKATIVDWIAAKHHEIDGQAHSGIDFHASSKDEYNRMKANCTKFFRYVEDSDDEKNLFDLLPSILAAMPVEQRMNFATHYLRPAGLSVRLIEEEDETGLTMETICDTQIAVADAMKAMTIAHRDPTPENLDLAERAADRATGKFKRVRAFFGCARKLCKGAFNKANHALHRKEQS
jgi:hypothetical protein